MFIYIEKGAIFLKLHRDLSSGKGGGVLLGILGGGMPPGSPNPDPISDQKMSFFTASKICTSCH